MEFKKSDVVENAGGGSSSEMSLEEFLNNLSENFEQVESILEKADKTGLALGNSGGNSQDTGRHNNTKTVDQMIEENRGGGSSQDSNSNSTNAQSSPSSSSTDLAQIVYQILNKFDDDTEMDVVEQELKGHVAHIFTEIPNGATVGDIKGYLESPMGQKILNQKAEEMI